MLTERLGKFSSFVSALSIITTLYLGSIRCFQDNEYEKSSEDQDTRWIVLPGSVESDCKGDENEWIKPTVTGFLVGQLIGGVTGVALSVAFIYHCILKNLKFPK